MISAGDQGAGASRGRGKDQFVLLQPVIMCRELVCDRQGSRCGQIVSSVFIVFTFLLSLILCFCLVNLSHESRDL